MSPWDRRGREAHIVDDIVAANPTIDILQIKQNDDNLVTAIRGTGPKKSADDRCT